MDKNPMSEAERDNPKNIDADAKTPSHETILVEKDVLQAQGLFVVAASFTMFLVFAMFLTYYLFSGYRDFLVKQDIAVSSNVELTQLRAYETEELSSYGFADEKKTRVRIPLKNAVDEVIASYKKR